MTPRVHQASQLARGRTKVMFDRDEPARFPALRKPLGNERINRIAQSNR